MDFTPRKIGLLLFDRSSRMKSGMSPTMGYETLHFWQWSASLFISKEPLQEGQT
jgi:hypothetical protein